MRDKTLFLGNYILGMRRDGSLTQEATRDENAGVTPYILHSLKTMENYDIDYEDGALVPRDGYERYNTNVLADSPKQLYYYTNLTRSTNIILGIVGDRWYKIQEATIHEMVIDEAVTLLDGFKKPMFTWGDRIFFATDEGWYWTNADRLYDGTKYYQAGISKPLSPPVLTEVASVGQTVTAGMIEKQLNTDTHRKIAFKIVTENQLNFDQVRLYMKRTTINLNGNIRVGIYTDDEGEPTDTLADTFSLSDWVGTGFINITEGFISIPFSKFIKLDTGTYWIILEGDDNYYNLYRDAVGVEYYISVYTLDVGYEPTNYGVSYWGFPPTGSVGDETWETLPENVGIFYFGGLVADRIYDYVYTYVNSTYGIESRASDPLRVEISADYKSAEIYVPIETDEQIDKYRIYRRTLDEDLEVNSDDSLITSTYSLVAEVDIGDVWIDASTDAGLGADLQTQDHYLITEPDDTNNNYRTAIVPAGACIWKGRVWVFKANDNVLYYSKKLTEDGATGITGDPIPDYFPLTNKLEIDEESAILAIQPLANDQLAIYLRSGTIYTLWGMDSVENPPSDYSLRPQVYGLGLISSWGLTDYKSMHVFLSRFGLYSFSGSPNPEYLSESIQSILDEISDTSLAKSVVIARGEEIWLLVDENNDGFNDTIYILELQKSVKPWRRYTYGININDLLVKTLSSYSKDIIASDNDNMYVLELNVGTLDNGAPVQSYIETHRQKVKNAYLYEVGIQDYYDSDDVPAGYDFLITDAVGIGTSVGINPSSALDIRGHKTGMRLRTSGVFNVKMSQITVQKVHLLGIYLRYTES